MVSSNEVTRRPLKTRSAKWAQSVMRFLFKCGVRPNAVSIASIVFSLFACVFFVATRCPRCESLTSHVILFVLAACCIQFRLLCNMLDGMLAVECSLRSNVGELYNDFPDRISDSAILIGAGYLPHLPWSAEIGYLAAILALLTAYTRLLGGSLGLKQVFLGPMAKPHRMFLLTVASLGSCIEILYTSEFRGWTVYIALCIIVLGSIVTTLRRLSRIEYQLNHPHD